MFVAQAHSFTQQARLAITLAWVAGYTNIVTILACGTVTSHVSGTTSNLGRDIAEGRWNLAAFTMMLLATFYFGAALSGFCTEFGRRRAWESIYVLPIVLEAILLLGFAIGIERHRGGAADWSYGLYIVTALASTAMGLQNATITRISSGVVRTTHVTGVMTDFGLESSQFAFWLWDRRQRLTFFPVAEFLRFVRRYPAVRRLALLISIVGSFAFGAALGTLAYDHIERFAMVPPVLFLIWIIAQDVLRPIAEIEESELTASAGQDGLPGNIAIYHVHKDPSRRGAVHRMPNLLVWAGRLPRHIQIVILDLGHEARLDRNAAMDIRAVLSMLKAQGRRLILAGLDHDELEQLRRAGPEHLDPRDVCIDIDMAFIHAMSLAAFQDHPGHAAPARPGSAGEPPGGPPSSSELSASR